MAKMRLWDTVSREKKVEIRYCNIFKVLSSLMWRLWVSLVNWLRKGGHRRTTKAPVRQGAPERKGACTTG